MKSSEKTLNYQNSTEKPPNCVVEKRTILIPEHVTNPCLARNQNELWNIAGLESTLIPLTVSFSFPFL